MLRHKNLPIQDLISQQSLHLRMKTCLYLAMVEIQVIQHPEDADQPHVIIIMVRWSLELATAFFKGFLSLKRYAVLGVKLAF